MSGPRVFLLIGCVLALCVSMAWASGGGDTGGAATAVKGPVTLTGWHFLDPNGDTARGKALKGIIDNFQKKYPNVTVKFETTPWAQLSTKYMTAYNAGNAPDFSWVEISYVAQIMDQGSAADLAPWIKRDLPADIAKDFPNAMWKIGLTGQSKYAMTTYHMSHALGYRKSLLQKAGIDGEKVKSWDAFIKACQQVTVDKNGRHPGDAGFDKDNVVMWGFGAARTRQQQDLPLDRILSSLGQRALVEGTWKANWLSPDATRTVQMLADFITKYQFESERDLTYNNEDQVVNYARGQFAVGIVGSQKYQDLMNKATFDKSDLGLMRWPTYDGRAQGGPVDTWGWAIVVNPKSKQKDVAWEFLKEYETPESDLLNVKIGGQLPARLSTTKDDYFSSPGTQHLRWYLQYNSETSFINLYQAPPGYDEEVIMAFQKIVLNKVPVEAALKEAAANWDKRLR